MTEMPTLEQWFVKRDPQLANLHTPKLLNAMHDALAAQRVLSRALHGGPQVYIVREYRRSGLMLPVLGLTGQILPRTPYTSFFFYFDLTAWQVACRLGSPISYFQSENWNSTGSLDWKIQSELEDSKSNEPFAKNQQNFTLWLSPKRRVLAEFAGELYQHLPH